MAPTNKSKTKKGVAVTSKATKVVAKRATSSKIVRRNPPRKCKRPRGRAVSRSRTARQFETRFDTLPFDPLVNILRFTSHRPYDEDWMDYIKPNMALTFFKSGGELSRVAHFAFDKIEVSEKATDARRGLLVLGKGNESRLQFPKMVNALANVLTEIRVSRPTFPVAWTKPLVLRMPNLKKLSLSVPSFRPSRFPLNEILTAHRDQLQSLELSWKVLARDDVKAIQSNCNGLRTLTLNFPIVAAKLNPIWKTVGPSLEELVLNGPLLEQSWMWADEKGGGMLFDNMKAIGEHCKALHRLEMTSVPREWHNDLTTLCEGLGGQLDALSLGLSQFSAPNLLRVREACRNVFFNLIEVAGCSTAALLAMGSRVSHVGLGPKSFPDFDDPNDSKWKGVSEKCENLVSVSLMQLYRTGIVPDNAFEMLFSAPKKHLKHISINFTHKDVQRSVIAALVTHVDTLEDFDLTGEVPPVEALQKLANASPNMRSVKIRTNSVNRYCHCTCSDSQERQLRHNNLWPLGAIMRERNWGVVTKIFLDCPAISDLEFSCANSRQDRPGAPRVPAFANVCYPARRRSISVSICHHQYA